MTTEGTADQVAMCTFAEGQASHDYNSSPLSVFYFVR